MGEVPEGRRGTGSVEAPAHIRIDQGCIDCRKHLIGMLQHIDIPELSRDLVMSPSGPIGPPPPSYGSFAESALRSAWRVCGRLSTCRPLRLGEVSAVVAGSCCQNEGSAQVDGGAGDDEVGAIARQGQIAGSASSVVPLEDGE